MLNKNQSRRILILGGSGMLGHKLWLTFASRFDTYVTLRRPFASYAHVGMFEEPRALSGVYAEDFESVKRAFETVNPDVVVNCIGVVKQDAAAKDPVTSITINSLFPHQLAGLCGEGGARLIHLSTDCVFSGRKGNYSEMDQPDATDLYGRTKLLGEAEGKSCLTIRTSMIGRELEGSQGLLEWFLAQEGKSVHGFSRAVFSGFTTDALAQVIADVISRHPDLNGIRHVAAETINKLDLLSLIKEVYGLNVVIETDESFVCDRSLNGSRFRDETGILAPSWPEMISEMHDSGIPYDDFRRAHAAR